MECGLRGEIAVRPCTPNAAPTPERIIRGLSCLAVQDCKAPVGAVRVPWLVGWGGGGPCVFVSHGQHALTLMYVVGSGSFLRTSHVLTGPARISLSLNCHWFEVRAYSALGGLSIARIALGGLSTACRRAEG